MNSTNRIVINSVTRRTAPVVIILDQDNPSGFASWTNGSTASKAFQAMLAMGILGAIAHEGLGVGVAMVLTLMVLPVLSGVLAMLWTSRGDESDLALQSCFAAALVAPALTLPGAMFGWAGAVLWALAALVARHGYQTLTRPN